MKKIIKATFYFLLILIQISCKENKTEINNDSKNESIFNLSSIDSINMTDYTNGEKLYFNVDLSYKGFQVVHLSSDNMYIPFMLVCKVDASPDPADRTKYIINGFEVAVRSVGKNPATYFEIVPEPLIVDYPIDGYLYKLNAGIDLNISSSAALLRRTIVQHNLKKVSNGDLMEVDIDPKKLIQSLNDLNTDNSEEFNNYIKEVEKRCCEGAICSLRLIF